MFKELNAILAGHLEQEVPAASANAACEGHQQEHEEKEVEPGLRDRGSFGRYVLCARVWAARTRPSRSSGRSARERLLSKRCRTGRGCVCKQPGWLCLATAIGQACE